MDMKNIILPTALAAATLLGSLPTLAATQVTSLPEARAQGLINDDGIIIFAYADGWEKNSKKRCEKLLTSEAIHKAAGNAVLLPVPVPARMTDECQAQRKALCGSIGVPGANSYPAIIMLTPEGKHYATLCGKEIARGKIATVAKMLADRMSQGRKRSQLLAAAEKATGPEKAKLIFDAYQLDGLTGFGRGFAGHVAQFDPKDTTGAPRAAAYDHYGFMNTLNNKPTPELVEWTDKHLADPAYTDRQKQQMCVAAAGILRRRSGSENTQHLRRYAELMKTYAPESAEGRAADFILREWVQELSCEKGWAPSCLPSDQKPVELKGKLPIDGPGTYTVRFDYTAGKWALTVLAVELYDSNTKVTEDRHTGSAGFKNKNNTYTLKVDKTLGNPRIFISFDMPERDSRGNIVIEKR